MSTPSVDTPPVARAWLFVPGDRPERFDRAVSSGADVVIVDLEDAVAPDAKARARAALASWLASTPIVDTEVVVRVNEAARADFAPDVELLRGLPPVRVMLPKADAASADLLRAALPACPGVVALVESARGVADARALAALPGTARLAFGAVDLALDLGLPGDADDDHWEALLHARSELVLASRLAGLPAPLDGVTLALDDADAAGRDALRARRLGFGGKLCIHPRQLEPVHRAFGPSDAERAWAARVLDAADAARGAAVAVDGRMVDRPVLLRARRILDAADRPGRRQAGRTHDRMPPPGDGG